MHHILVAEDNPALGGVVRFNLERAGFDVTLANNGLDAWERSQEEDFDLVVTDQQMPQMTGTELCERLRQDERYASTPIIMLTAKGLELDLASLQKELGISVAMPKPFSPSELVRVVSSCLNTTETIEN